jgi:hypothetical protein
VNCSSINARNCLPTENFRLITLLKDIFEFSEEKKLDTICSLNTQEKSTSMINRQDFSEKHLQSYDCTIFFLFEGYDNI